VQIDSPLVVAERLAGFLDFPYADGQEIAGYVGSRDSADRGDLVGTIQ